MKNAIAHRAKKPALDAIQDALCACTNGIGSPLDRIEQRINLARHYVQLSANAMDETQAEEAVPLHGLAHLLTEVETDLGTLSNSLTHVSNQVYALQHPDSPLVLASGGAK
jgi:hypothetical protein